MLGGRYAEFETLSAVEKPPSYVLGSENWEDYFDTLLHLVKEIIIAIWEVQKQKLYGDDSYPGQLQRQSSARDRDPVAGVGVSWVSLVSHIVRVIKVCNVCGSANSCGCVVNQGG